MSRWSLLLILPLLGGCHASSSSPPSANIDAYRNAYFGQGALPQVAAAPGDAAREEQAPPPSHKPDKAPAGPDAAAPAENPAPAAHTQTPRYQASVAAYIKRYAADPKFLKLAKIGTPFSGAVNGQKGSVVCVELNGSRTAYLLKNNAVADSEWGANSCRDQHLQPWDDLGGA